MMESEMTEAQWQDAATLRLRALERQIKFYTGKDESLDRTHLSMARSEHEYLSAALSSSRAA